MQNLKILNYYIFFRKLMPKAVQMFPEQAEQPIHTYVNTHLICIKYAKIHNTKNMLYLPIIYVFLG